MGNYTQLYLGNMYFSWKNEIPEYLAFIFEESDFYVSYKDDGEIDKIGYKTNWENAKTKLEKFGYTLQFCVDIYTFFYKEYFEYYQEDLKKHLLEKSGGDIDKVNYKINSIINKFPKLSRLEEYKDFIHLLKSITLTNYKNPWAKGGKLVLADGETINYPPRELAIKEFYEDENYRIDFETLYYYLSGEGIQKYPPHVIILTSLLSIQGEYSDILTLVFLRTVLEIPVEKTFVNLDLSDIIYEESEAKELIKYLPQHLLEKISLYNNVFHKLFMNEEEIQVQYAKNQCKQYLLNCLSTSSISEKGRNLEDLIEVLFTLDNSLELIDKRVSTGDEEIDLVIKNNINRPFWIAFNSPLFFIECKNWKNVVGSKELRNFEIKMQNHSKLVKVGFFVSINGFTSEVKSELKRIGRDNYHIILIDKGDIEEFLSSPKSFFDWLEKRAAVIY